MSFLTAGAHRMSLRIMSQTPVSGTEEARSLMFDRYGMMWVGTDQGVRTFQDLPQRCLFARHTAKQLCAPDH